MNRISILIPTMNRPEFISRVLHYYSRRDFLGKLLIADSSADSETEKIVADFPKLRIIYHHYPKEAFHNEISAMDAILEYAETPYVVFQGDDDFIVLRGVQKAADFLDDNQDFCMAGGGQIRFMAQDKVFTVDDLKIPMDYSSPSCVERFKTYMRSGMSLIYFLCRLDTIKNMFQYHQEMTLPAVGTEILPCCLAVLSGRGKCIPFITSLQQGEHEKTIFPRNSKKFDMPSFFKIMIKKEWPEQFHSFKQIIVNKMIELGEPSDMANYVFDSEMVYRVLVLLDEQLNKNYDLLHPDLTRWETYQNIMVEKIKTELSENEGDLHEVLRPVLEVL